MAWKQIGSWGTHQERKERRRHRRGNDEREAVEAELEVSTPVDHERVEAAMKESAEDALAYFGVSFDYDPDEHYAPIKLVPVDEDSFEAW